MTLSAGSRTH